MNNFKNEMMANIQRGSLQTEYSHQPQHQLQGNISVNAKSLVDKVFDQLASIFPAWKQAWPDQEATNAAKIEWVKAFLENGVNSIDHLKEGFRMARSSDSDFLPSPGKFAKWCVQSDFDVDGAYIRFLNREKPENEVEVITRGEIGFNCRSASEHEAKKIFERHYTVNYKKWLKGSLRASNQKLISTHSSATDLDIERDNFKPKSEDSAKMIHRLNKIRKGRR